MKKGKICDEKLKAKTKENINKSEKQIQNANNKLNIEDPNFDINNFCPDISEIKTRSHTVRESVKKGQLKKYIEEEKANKNFLKTPQVRPLMRTLNPTPLRLNPFSCRSSKLNLIKEENIILSEHEEESEYSEYSSSSFEDSEFEKEDEKEEQINENTKKRMNKGKNIEQKILEEDEEEKEEEKIEEKKEKEKDEEEKEEEEEEKEEKEKEEEVKEEEEIDDDKNINNKKEEEKTNDNRPAMGILGCLIKEHNKTKEKKNEEMIEMIEENELISLREIRKNMKVYRKSFTKRNRDMFNLFDLNIKNSHQKFKKDVLNEKKSDDEDTSDEKNKINEINKIKKCRPILDFYVHNTPIIKKTM